MIPEALPMEKASIGLGLLNGFGTISFSLVTPMYGSLVDSTGSYLASNIVLLAFGCVMTAIIILFTKETYGSLKKTN
jgi:cyanate permease